MALRDWPIFGGLARLFSRKSEYVWTPGRIGPRFKWLDHTHLHIFDGPLAGRQVELITEVMEKKANCFSYLDGKQVGRCYIERDPPGKGIVLWDIAVQDGLRRHGLASIMTYTIFRELLTQQNTATFKIRMMRLMKPTDRNVELQNVGIGVIGNRLGFIPEFDIKKVLAPSNITGMEILPAKGNFPPSFKIVIRTFPLVLIAFILDQDTLKPVDDFRTYVKLSKDETIVYDWVRRGLIVVGNGNYILRAGGIDQFVNHIATDQFEAKVFRRRIKPI